ncbi:hypothetical protein FM107_16325 [Sphingobacterium sp. JB170]|nr:hypothetical protein FM107_16325 [Sphingobacterium sp. JB170]
MKFLEQLDSEYKTLLISIKLRFSKFAVLCGIYYTHMQAGETNFIRPDALINVLLFFRHFIFLKAQN